MLYIKKNLILLEIKILYLNWNLHESNIKKQQYQNRIQIIKNVTLI